jgi:trimeric autotransporter adhesin
MNQNRKPLSGRAFRAALLAGVSTAALFMAMGRATQAQTLSIGTNQTADVINTTAITSTNGTQQTSGTQALIIDGGKLKTVDTSGSSQVDIQSGQITAFAQGNSTTLTGLGVSSLNTQGQQSSLSGSGFGTQDSQGRQSSVSSSGFSVLDTQGHDSALNSTGLTVCNNASPPANSQCMAANAAGVSVVDGKTGNAANLLANGGLIVGKSNGQGPSSTVGQGTFFANGTDGGSTSVSGGFVNITGGLNTNAGSDISTLNTANAALSVSGGAAIQNGLLVRDGANISGGTTTDTLNVTGTSAFGGRATFTNGGPGGTTILGSNVISSDSSGNIGIFNGGLLRLTNGANPKAQITLDATVDPVLTVTNGTAAGTTTINNGAVTAGTSVTVGTNANNQTVINNGSVTTNSVQVNNNLTVAPGANVDFGGNALHGVGPGVLGTDAVNVNQLNSAVSTLNKRIDKADQGIAIAMAVQNPILTGSDRFGVSVNWGDFAGNNAVGFAAAGVVGQNLFGTGEKMAVTGGFGFGTGGRGDSQASGRAGIQFTW